MPPYQSVSCYFISLSLSLLSFHFSISIFHHLNTSSDIVFPYNSSFSPFHSFSCLLLLLFCYLSHPLPILFFFALFIPSPSFCTLFLSSFSLILSLYLWIFMCLCLSPFLLPPTDWLSVLFPPIHPSCPLLLSSNLRTINLLPSTRLVPFISPSVFLSLPPTDGSSGSSEDPHQLHVRLSVSAGPDGIGSE